MSICFFNGEFIPEDAVRIDPSDRGYTLGDGVFDTQLAVDGVLPDHALHFKRLIRHAEAIHLTSPYAAEELDEFAHVLLHQHPNYVVRTQISRGTTQRGLALPVTAKPNVLIRISPPPGPQAEPVVMIAHTVRNETSVLSFIKATHYLDAILALQDAQDHGCNDAIFLNMQGNVTCATSSNVFIVENGKWVTPPLHDGVMDGITRVKTLREKHGHEDTIPLTRLRNADEIWLTNSVLGVRKVLKLK